MGIDTLSPIAPAQINVLVVPAGKITRSRYASFVKRLRSAHKVRLGDVSPARDAKQNAFNLAAFPSGSILFNFSDVDSKRNTVESFPFELNREPQLILAIADGHRLEKDKRLANGGAEQPEAHHAGLDNLLDEVQNVYNQHRRALLARLLVFEGDVESLGGQEHNVSLVPPPSKSNSTTMKTLMCDIASLWVPKLHELAKEVQDLPVVESPWKQKGRSQAVDSNRLQHRMTMPARSTSGRDGPDLGAASLSSLAPSRSPTVSRSGTPLGTRPASQLVSREVNQDRGSTAGGPVALADRNRNRAAGRIAVVLGGLYMQAGLWPDAMRELERGFTTCRGMSDYLWHGRALELMIACLLMYGWAGVGFQIPQVCYPVTEKKGSANANAGGNAPKDVTEALHNLAQILPDLFSMAINLYARAANFTQEQLPQIMLFEAHLRMINTLSALHLRDGVLDEAVLPHFVEGHSLRAIADNQTPSRTLLLRKHELSAMMNQTMTLDLEHLTSDEAIYVLNGLASHLSTVGLHRKQAFFVRELIEIIIPKLIHARKVGAAEMGIHPAAGLSALITAASNGDEEASIQKLDSNGLRPLLKTMMSIYGIYDTNSTEKTSLSSREFSERVGDVALKVDVLRACVNICEALPELRGIVDFSVQLLHATKGTMFMPEIHSIGGPLISQEEQTRLANVINRTVEAGSRFGITDIEADYWDEFLVRDIEYLEQNPNMRLRPHTKKDLDLVGAGEEGKPKDPFIFNPFAKSTSAIKDEITLVADEPAHFRITFQNPFDFDIEVDLLSLHTDGCDFEPVEQSLLIGPYCLQKIIMVGTPREEGQLSVKGVSAKIRGCRQRSFSTFKEKPKTVDNPKLKSIGIVANKAQRPTSTESTSLSKSLSGPTPEALKMKVVNSQPVLSVKGSSLSQLAVMVIEGESKSFEITLQNTSKTIPVDFLLFTFQDSATRQVQNALTNRELSPGDLYDLQWMLLENPAMRLKTDLSPSTSRIEPGASAKFLVEITGRPGLLDGTIQIDYAYLGKEGSDVSTKFYTRQLTIPVAVTVNAGLELVRCNISPLSGDFAWANQQLHANDSPSSIDRRASSLSPPSRSTSTALRPHSRKTSSISSSTTTASSIIRRKAGNQFTSLLSRLGVGMYGDDHCLVLLDLRNSWPFPLSVTISVREKLSKIGSPSQNPAPPIDPTWSRAYAVHETIQPGHTTRSVLIIPRIFLQNLHDAIPTLGNARQFVVSSSKISPETERANREAFWFREELLKYLRGSWVEESTGRHGYIDLRRALRLNQRMIEVLKIQDVEISMTLSSEETSVDGTDPPSTPNQPIVERKGKSRFSLQTNEFATLRATITNRSNRPVSALLRLQPSLRDQPHIVALDLVKRLAWTGMLQQTLHPVIEPGQTREVELGIIALCEGAYEVGATVEEVVAKVDEEDVTSIPAMSQPQRRIWYAREACLIDSVE